MKNIKLILILGISVFILLSCGGESKNIISKVDKNESNFKIVSISCSDDDLKNCLNETNNTNIENILKINEKVCDLGEKISVNDYKDIFVNFDNKTDLVSNINLIDGTDGIKELTFTIEKNNIDNSNKGKNINIMYDLTYFSTKKKDIEKDVIGSRKKFLLDIIDNGIGKFQINYGDKINLFYIGTFDYGEYSKGHKNYAITDKNKFILKNIDNNLSGTYKILYTCEKNNRKKKLKMYYKVLEHKNISFKKEKNNLYVSNISELKNELINTINNKYNSGEFNKGTYLIESLDKNKEFLNGTGSINILISDMFFQIHPEMKKNKNIKGAEFDFTPEYILKLGKYKDYTAFYNYYIPKYLKDKCNNGEELYIIGANLSDNLDVKLKMKEYYKNILFKGCNVHFN